jgi:hypothetical protein
MKKKSALTLFALVLLSGCSQSASETTSEDDSSPTANATQAAETSSAAPTTVIEPPDATSVTAPIDAAKLLASTLERAQVEDKRVIVHLGAPW